MPGWLSDDELKMKLAGVVKAQAPDSGQFDADYLAAWWDVVNWDAVAEEYAQARS